MSITREEWLKALGEAAGPEDPDAATIRELADLLSLSERAARRRVELLVRQKKATLTTKRVQSQTGYWTRVTAYKLV